MRISSFVPSEEIFNSGLDGIKVGKKDNKGELFSNVLKESLDKINEKQIVADKSTEAFVKGEDIDISEVMLAGAEASASLQFAVQVRNKLVEAYQEISRMQL
ncbi:flagellar hook-basal body complex protein FliE [Clostridium paraputrificum]|uniref:flagellar hook-basal body complex protein FliE n=1 Tax=Clostridium paraputrificum TaxID=29363 RepID=UPI0018973E9A|nr:flagellar hook-basal body complex protein FliE [Clostridium paraputrificum]MDB2125049.1 flagellar hook-basal body complex protein FliE [Clostridium paraputrificum]